MISNRTALQLFVPIVLMVLVAGLSFCGMVALMCWTGVGALALTVTDKRSVSAFGRGQAWRCGWRKIVVVSYNLFWWPWVIGR